MRLGVASLIVMFACGLPVACSSANNAPLQADPPIEAAEELVLGTDVRRDLLVELGRDARFIDVDADTRTEGKVILSGPVRSEHIRQLAVDVASQSATEVDDQMTVDPGAAPEPTAESEALQEANLEVEVMLALLERMGPDAAEIAVEVEGYEVTLIGEVDEADDHTTAIEVARGHERVAEVHDELSVILSGG